ncbi:uncharacterized protein LOC128878922 [Hylaeus volcanicus]|uniref:uncharacterized protein LOC128878922 n=1 Tax=Hylaeus volcanicus TaxID=313075 RepID=UPI0023B828E3|nr:uncharacterized protein LOC128878922 [Hylaeus volcanicus]
MRQTILKLYKDLLRYGDTLKYTETKYYKNKIRSSFKENKCLTNQADIDFQIQKGNKLLEYRRIV